MRLTDLKLSVHWWKLVNFIAYVDVINNYYYLECVGNWGQVMQFESQERAGIMYVIMDRLIHSFILIDLF